MADAVVGEGHLAVLLVHLEVDLVLDQLGHHRVDAEVLGGVLLAGAGDDQRGAGLVDEDGVHLVDDGVHEAALGEVLQGPLHVVAQVVEADLVVGGVGDVAGVGVAPLLVGEPVLDHAHGQAQPVVEPAHPLGVAPGQVVVHGDQVGALAGQAVQVQGQGGGEGLALAGPHLGHLAAMQDHAANELNIKMPHAQHAPGGFPHHREGLGEDLLQGRAVGQEILEIGSLGLELLVA